MAREITSEQRFYGAMLGSVIGDAYGYPLTEMTYEQICDRFEELGAMELAVSARTKTALFTDATQMALFTADGLLWAAKDGKAYDNTACAGYVFYSYQLWLYTQTKSVAGKEYHWLLDQEQNPDLTNLLQVRGLTKNRFVHNTNLKALAAARNNRFGRPNAPVNQNTDNCALKRMTPVGMFYSFSPELAFRIGCETGAITHSHPDGFLPCGVYAAMLAYLIRGNTPDQALEKAMDLLQQYPDSSRIFNALSITREMAENTDLEPMTAVEQLGYGEDAAECLAISVLCLLIHGGNYKHAIQLATNHDGDSSACGAVTGGLVGAYLGEYNLPKKWVNKMQYQKLVRSVIDRLYDAVESELDKSEETAGSTDEDDYVRPKKKRI